MKCGTLRNNSHASERCYFVYLSFVAEGKGMCRSSPPPSVCGGFNLTIRAQSDKMRTFAGQTYHKDGSCSAFRFPCPHLPL
jgi:hypothetical protein